MPLDVLRRLLTPLREPIVTSRYPDAPPVLQPATRGLPDLDPARCERAGACVTACPTAAIELREASWDVDAGRCLFCSACALACPHDAIRLGRRIELAGRDRADLITVTVLKDRR